jgi:hypothetical protein
LYAQSDELLELLGSAGVADVPDMWLLEQAAVW